MSGNRTPSTRHRTRPSSSASRPEQRLYRLRRACWIHHRRTRRRLFVRQQREFPPGGQLSEITIFTASPPGLMASHTFKFGADTLLTWRDRRDTSSQGDFGCSNTSICSGNGFSQQVTGSPSAPGSGLSLASFLLGGVTGFGRVIYARNLPLAHNTRQALFAQDTWKATSKLTLTLGLRWDYNGYPTSPQKGGIANFNYSNTNTIISSFGNTSATANVDQNYRDFEPRVGIAYRLDSHTVIRTVTAEQSQSALAGPILGRSRTIGLTRRAKACSRATATSLFSL